MFAHSEGALAVVSLAPGSMLLPLLPALAAGADALGDEVEPEQAVMMPTSADPERAMPVATLVQCMAATCLDLRRCDHSRFGISTNRNFGGTVIGFRSSSPQGCAVPSCAAIAFRERASSSP